MKESRKRENQDSRKQSLSTQAQFIALVLAFLLVPTDSFSAVSQEPLKSTTGWIEGLQSGAKEIISSRSETTKQFLNPDGTIQHIISSGPLHYRESDTWQEIDTTILPSKSSDSDFEMTQSIYKAWFRKDFTADRIVRLEKDDHTLQVAPGDLYWSNESGIHQLIAAPQKAETETDGTKIIYRNAYGASLDFVYNAFDIKLSKQLIISKLAALKEPSAEILEGDNPTLSLDVYFDVSNDLEIYVGEKPWDGNPLDIKGKRLEFKKDGKRLWHFAPPEAWDEKGNRIDGDATIVGARFIAPGTSGAMNVAPTGMTVRLTISIPYSWLKNTEGQITIDPDTYYGAATDGYITGAHASSCGTANATSTASDASATTVNVGIDYAPSGTQYTIHRAYLEFNTSQINGGVVGQGNLYLKASSDSSATDFTVQIIRYDWLSPITSAREVNYDDASATYANGLGSFDTWRSTSGMATATYYASSNLTTSYISTSGTTRYALMSDGDLSDCAPIQDAFIAIHSQDAALSSDRPYLSIITVNKVTSTADTNTLGTLRYAMGTLPASQTITFDTSVFPSGTPATITIGSVLPTLSQGSITIDATGAGVIVDGTGIAVNKDGFIIASSSNTLKNLVIKSFTDDGVQVNSGTSNTIQNCKIYSHTDDGIDFSSATTGGTSVIKGCYIGTDTAYTDLGNGDDGIYVNIADTTATLLTIGGTTAADANYIMWQDGNADTGIAVNDGSPKIIGNFIGADGTTTTARTNWYGINPLAGADNVQIGGSNAGEGNVIGFSSSVGIYFLSSSGTTTIKGNYIGTDSGWRDLNSSATSYGVNINGTGTVTVGGSASGEGNWIGFFDGSGRTGVNVSNGSPTIQGNYIGTNSSGTTLANQDGIILAAGADTVTVGGTASGAGNIISRNTDDGIDNLSTNTSIVIQGNFIGTDTAGTASWPNGGDGIQSTVGTLLIGNASESTSNVIGPNTGFGINLPNSTGIPIITFAGTVDVNDDIEIQETVATINMGSANVKLTGNWNNAGASTVNASTSTLTLDGAADQTITTSAKTFYSITLNNTGIAGSDDVVFVGNVDMDGSLTLTNGDFDLSNVGNPNVTLAGNLVINNSADPAITRGGGTWTFDGATAATISDATASGVDLGAVTLNKTDTVSPSANDKLTLAGNAKLTSITVDGTAGSPDTLDLTSSGYILTLTGNGTPLTVNSGGTFSAGTNSTVKFVPASTTGVTVSALTYHHVEFNKASNTFTLGGVLDANGNLTITAGTLDVSGSSHAISVGGNWSNGGAFTAGIGTVTFDGAGTITTPDATINAGSSAFHILVIDAASNGSTYDVQVTAANDVTADSVRIADGKLDLNGRKLTVTDTDPASGAKGLELSGATSNLTCGACIVDIDEVDATQAVIISNAASTVNFGTGNWSVAGGWDGIANNVIQALANSSLTFDGSGGPFTVDLAGGDTDLDIAFNTIGTGTGSWTLGSGFTADAITMNANDTAQTLTTGAYTIKATSLNIGNSLGAAYTLDTSSTTLDLAGAVTFTKGTGALTLTFTSSTWNVGTGWTMDANASVTGAPPVTFDVGSGNINSGGKSFGAITINASGATYTAVTNNISAASLTVTLGTLDLAALDLALTGNLLVNGGTLTASNAACDLDIDGNATVSSGTLTAPAAADDLSFLVGGSWEVSGTGVFTHSSGRIFFDAGAVGKTIVTTSSGADDFYQASFNKASGGWTASDAMEVLSDFTVTAGAFTAPSAANLTVTGDFLVTGTFTHNSGTVVLNGATDVTQNLDGNITFYNLSKTLSGTGTISKISLDDADTFTVTNSLTLTGVSGNKLILTSDVENAANRVDFDYTKAGTGTQSVSHVTAKYIDSDTGVDIIYNSGDTALTSCVGWKDIATAGEAVFIWDGATSTAWNTGNNWDVGAVPGTASNITVPDVTNDPLLDQSRTVNAVTINTGGVLGTNTYALTVTATLANSGTLNVATAGTPFSAATFTNNAGSVVNYTGVVGDTDVNIVVGTYDDITFNNTGTNFLLQGNIIANDDLTLTAGILDTDSNGATAGGTVYNITTKGNANFSGTFTSRTGTVTLFNDGVDEIKILTTGGVGNAFNNLTINHTAATTNTARISGALNVDGALTLSDGTLDLDTNNVAVNVAGDVSIASGASVTPDQTGPWTFDGVTQSYADNNVTKQNLGVINVGT